MEKLPGMQRFNQLRPEFLYQLILIREFFFRFRVRGTKKKKIKKTLKMTMVTYRAFFVIFRAFFFLQKNSKTSKVNQQSVLNL